LPKLLAAFILGYNYFSLPEQGTGRALDWSIITENLPLVILVALPLVLLVMGVIRLHRRSTNQEALWFAHALCTVPILGALFLAVTTGMNWLQPKYLISSVPFALLFIALAWTEIRSRSLRTALLISGALVLTVSWLHFNNDQAYGRREDWRGAATYLRAHLNGNSRLIITQGTWWLLDYYGSDLHSYWLGDYTAPPERRETATCAKILRAGLGSAQTAYYLRVDTFQNQADPDDQLPAALDQIGTRKESIQFNPRLKLLRWDITGQ
jgi:hypothetical protein